jgi:hypothetical protein
MGTLELRLRESEFAERRGRVLRSQAAVGAVFVAGLALVAAARAAAPGAFEPATAFLSLGTLGALLVASRTARRHWRCPVCHVRWEAGHAWASAAWNHCPACGAALRAHPRQRDAERLAATRFAQEDVPHDRLVARFERRRRRALRGAGAVAAAGIAALVWVQGRGWGERVEQLVVAAVAGLVTALAVLGARCPRCRSGAVLGRQRHCQRCGLSLAREIRGPADSPAGP